MKGIKHLLPYLSFLLLALIFTPMILQIQRTDVKLIPSTNSTWDLSDAYFDHYIYYLLRPVQILEGFHTPEEFTELEEQAFLSRGNFPNEATYRVRIHLPSNQIYTFTKSMTGESHQIFINGVPVNNKQNLENSASSSRITLTIIPEDGWVEIVHQVSNVTLVNPDDYENWFVGTQSILAHIRSFDYIQSIVMGCFFILSIMFLYISILQIRSWKAIYKDSPLRYLGLHFAMFCLVWGIRTGITGSAVMLDIIPQISWVQRIRTELILNAITVILLVLITNHIFQDIIKKVYMWTFLIINTLFISFFVFAPMNHMRLAVGMYVIFYTFVNVFILIRASIYLNMKQKDQFIQYQVMFLIGFVIFFYLLMRDTLNHLGIYLLPPIVDSELLNSLDMDVIVFNLSMLIMALFMATTVIFETDRVIRNFSEASRQHKLLLESYSIRDNIRNEMIATISHEARTPLAVLSSYSMMIAMELKELDLDEEVTSSLDVIVSESKRVADLIENLNEISLQNVKRETSTIFYMDELVNQVVKLYKRTFNSEEIEFQYHIEEKLKVVGFPEQISQVMFNLLQNAKNHVKRGKIIVNSKRIDSYIITEVIDDGYGIPRDNLLKIFQHGFSTNESSGLGLPICKEIIQNHGGTIEVRSTIDEGTKVTFYVPEYIDCEA